MPPLTRTRVALPIIVAATLGLLLFVPALARLLTDWWWFQEIGFQVLFARELTTKVGLFSAGAVLVGGGLWLNLRLAQGDGLIDPVAIETGRAMPLLNLGGVLRRLSVPIALGFGGLFGLGVAASWDSVLLAFNQVPFGTTDPVFGRDVGYYVFTLPVLAAALAFLWSLAVLALLLVIPIYWVRQDIRVRGRALHVARRAGLHLAILLAAALVLSALRLWLVDTAALLYSGTGPLVGASYTDIKAQLPALRLSAVVALLAAVAVLVGAAREQLIRTAALALGGYAVIAVLARAAFPPLMQKFIVAPTELTYETPYLERHIEATRRAWGLDSVEVRELEGEANLTLAHIRANATTIENVRLWDREPLLQTFRQLQEIRTYYDFVSVDDDRYWIDGTYRQVLLSPRELNSASLPTRTFINEHLTFTHGMGLTLGPVNQVTTEGLPVLFIKDLPPASTVSLRVTRPQIYFGERTDNFVVTATRQREFDHPAGEANVYTAYDGSAGVGVGGLLRRATLALRFGSAKMLLSGDITAGSRVLFDRNIRVRASKALPFLRFDRDPYMVVADDGTLHWILDAYTTTSRYPYAARLSDGTSYMRNSVKVVIDAYHGSVRAYISAPADPLVNTWARVLPGVFRPLDSLPADLRAHLRYPDDLFRVQTSLYTTYHMDSPEEFYHREDQWQIPVVDRSDGSVPFMRHLVMRLPEEAAAEFIYMVPFTPRGKDNLAAWMVARSDGAAYGRLRVYRLPRQSLVFGPKQIENRINQDTEISRQVSLWDQRGSRVIRGDLLVIPIENALLYVQPLYLQAEGGRIPELKRVVVAFENQVVMEETLDGALAALFGGSASTRGRPAAAGTVAAAGTADADLRAMVAEARRRYQAAMDAQRQGDWARYGEEMREVGRLLERVGAGAQGPR